MPQLTLYPYLLEGACWVFDDQRAGLKEEAFVLGMTENVFINIKNRSHTITADVGVPKGGANGVILAQAGRFGGWSLYLKDGKPTYAYNFLGLKTTKVAATEALPAGNATIRFELDYNGPGLGKGGTAKILVNGKQVATGKIERTQGNFFSADEGVDVGQDGETPVSDDYKERVKTSSPARSRKWSSRSGR